MIKIQNVKLAAVFIAILALILGGYALFLWFLVNIMKGQAAVSLVAVAAIAGVASFFNPCSFPLLPAYVAQYYTDVKQLTGKKVILNGFAAALGLLLFNTILGSAIGLLGAGFGRSLNLSSAEPNTAVLWLRGIVGALLVYFGISHVVKKGNPLARLARYLHPKSPAREYKTSFGRLFSYGFTYTLLGIGCGGPIMAGIFIFALAQGGFAGALLTFIIYSLVMALLMIIISVLIALSKEELLRTLSRATARIQNISGTLLILVGLFLVLSSVFVSTYTSLIFP